MVVILVDDRRGVDPAGGQEANGECITGQGEKEARPSGSQSLISAARRERKIRRQLKLTLNSSGVILNCQTNQVRLSVLGPVSHYLQHEVLCSPANFNTSPIRKEKKRNGLLIS